MEITEEEIKKYPWLRSRPGWYGAEEIPEEWKLTIMEMCAEIKIWLKEHNIPENCYFLDQGKEKYGDLCWYDEIKLDKKSKQECWDLRHKLHNEIIEKYKNRITHICLICGKELNYTLPLKGLWLHRECEECTNNK